jgi:uncharacterized membrane protein YoaK (UPF0700 family)
MLPFDSKPWAKPLSATIIVLTVLAAIAAPFYLHHIRHLDPPMAVLILLLVLAIVPPNIVVLRRHKRGEYPAAPPVVNRRNGLVTH